MDFSTLISRTQRVLQDLGATPTYWSLSEIKYQINEGYRDFVYKTRFKREKTRIVLYEGKWIYDLPSQCVQLLRAYWAGRPIDVKLADWMDLHVGSGWQETVGTVLTYIVQDSIDEQQFRTYPILKGWDSDYTFSQEPGIIVAIDDTDYSFDQEPGAIVRFSGLRTFFDQEPGAVVNLLGPSDVIEIDFFGRITSAREMVDDDDEPEHMHMEEHPALINYAVAELFENESDRRQYQKADRFRAKYNHYVHQAKQRSLGGFARFKQRVTPRRFV